jgi:Tol biopolymer transport system component
MLSRAAILALAIAGVTAVPARATLVYDRGNLKSTVWVAGDDGSHPRRLAVGEFPRISPDGKLVAYEVIGDSRNYRPDLMLIPADGSAPPRLLAKGWRDSFTFTWSFDSKTIATVLGPELGAKKLALIDVTTGAQRPIASGFFNGVSFSSADDALVYGRATSERYPPHSDVYRVEFSGGAPTRITHDGISTSPLWGPREQIVFVKLVDAKKRRYGPKNELYLMAPNGSGARRLTRTNVAPLLFGLTPTSWSSDGTELLTEFGGQDTSYAETVDPRTGGGRVLTNLSKTNFIGAALSHDGRTILGVIGFEGDPPAMHTIVTIPYAGGAPKVLVRAAGDPDWNR